MLEVDVAEESTMLRDLDSVERLIIDVETHSYFAE
jgi:hypothetical protein